MTPYITKYRPLQTGISWEDLYADDLEIVAHILIIGVHDAKDLLSADWKRPLRSDLISFLLLSE